MFRVKIFGAGSIGNHLAHASRTLGWDVVVCDVNAAALDRMKNQIYPQRYGKWDEKIQLSTNDQQPKGQFDLIIIGTPPDYHIPLALQALDENPKGIVIEKPLCGPGLDQAQRLYEKAMKSSTKVFVGYTHVVAQSTTEMMTLIAQGKIGEVLTFDVEFREHWGGIFKAHPWLSGPEDSYLGFWKSGGGASGEHSHAFNLWQFLAHSFGMGPVKEVTASLSYKKQGKAEYDDLCLAHLTTDSGGLGRVVQDVVTNPSKKIVMVQGTLGRLECIINYDAQGDAVIFYRPGETPQITAYPKKRPDDFIQELRHISDSLLNNRMSPLSLERGLETMLVIAAAHQSQKIGQRVAIQYNKGYTLEAVQNA